MLCISYLFLSIRSWAVATNLFWAGVLSVTVPRMVGAFGNTGALSFYAGLNVFSFVMIFLLVPGTITFIILALLFLFSSSYDLFLKKRNNELLKNLIMFSLFQHRDIFLIRSRLSFLTG